MSKKSYPVYTISRDLPGWVKKGHTQFQNQHAGPAELAKDILFQSSTIGYSFEDLMKADQLFYSRLTPDVVWEWTTKYSDKFLDEMQALGKDLIQVNWSCGFSTQSESIQRKIVTEFTQKAHKRSMKICAYLSLTNIFWKDAFEHEPQLKELTARYSNGRHHLYAYSQARYLACVNQPEWLEYLKNKVRMAIEDADVDAVYFDNLSAHCACGICKTLFAEFTERLVDKSYEIPAIEQVFPPGIKRERDDETILAEKGQQAVFENEDDISKQYMHRKFQAHRLAEALKQLRNYAFKLKSPLVFSANNHLSPFINDVCNVLYSQDTRLPGHEWSNIPYLRYLSADSDGWKPVVTNHPLNDADPRLSMAEAIAFQSYPYGITHKPYNLFYKNHPELFTEIEPVAKIGVILEYPNRNPYYLQLLGMNNLLYEVIILDKWKRDVLNKYKVILLPDLEAVGDDLCDVLKDFEENGGKVICTGASMLYDEFGRKRKEEIGVKRDEIGHRDRISPDIIERIRGASNPQYIEVDAPQAVVVNLVHKKDDSAYILHVINYNQSECGPVNIKINIPNHTFKEATLFSPDELPEQEKLSLSKGISISLDKLDICSIVVLKCRASQK